MNAFPCLFCGETEHVTVHEVWGHEWMLETCCGDLHQHLTAEMSDDPAWARDLLRALEIEALCGHELRRVADDDASMLLDWQLRIGPGLGWGETREFIARTMPTAHRLGSGASTRRSTTAVPCSGWPSSATRLRPA